MTRCNQVTTGMKWLLIIATTVLVLTACAPADPSINTPANRTIIDMAGREIVIPQEIDRIYTADPVCTILLYIASPEHMMGWSYPLNDNELAYIAPAYRDLTAFGMGSQVNFEAVIQQEPDVAILSGRPDETLIEKATLLEEKLGVPVIIVDQALQAAPEVFQLMGQVTGNTARAEQLSQYAQTTFDSVQSIPESEQVTIYYANGVDSLNTSAKGTAASQLFDMINAVNVCDLSSNTGDRIQVTQEHLLRWDPDFIFVNGEPKEDLTSHDAAVSLYQDPNYQGLQAVMNQQVITIPKAPFAWIDRPRSVNRIVGIRWLASVVYPDRYVFDTDDIREFYQLFYHMELSDEQIAQLMDQPDWQ